MIVCITARENSLDSPVDPRFGRAAWFLFFNTDTRETEAVENINRNGTGGIGVQSSQLIVDRRAEVLVTGRVGPNAMEALQKAGIRVYTKAEGTAEQALKDWESGHLPETDTPSNGPLHHSPE